MSGANERANGGGNGPVLYALISYAIYPMFFSPDPTSSLELSYSSLPSINSLRLPTTKSPIYPGRETSFSLSHGQLKSRFEYRTTGWDRIYGAKRKTNSQNKTQWWFSLLLHSGSHKLRIVIYTVIIAGFLFESDK